MHKMKIFNKLEKQFTGFMKEQSEVNTVNG